MSLEFVWLNLAWNQLNRDMPLLVVGENRMKKCSYSKDLRLQTTSKWCLDDEGMKVTQGFLKGLRRICGFAKMPDESESVFLLVGCSFLGFVCDRESPYIVCLGSFK